MIMFNQNTILSPEMRHEETCEQFALISFPDEEETFYIVASSWLEKTESSDFHICSWPSYKGDARIKVAVLENETPSCNWSKCSARYL
ncbi:hypothetical protein AVEN_178402-1 [Araneus ventricosus]|uniref:Uncharacterized protein n=1 Tax=Araneus ventricosus TaxID=182803 RepID=A0A4Y2BCG8_ARAVE|nr:hypothetical protein AVEN_178402-1 [Araneus ventricosus]